VQTIDITADQLVAALLSLSASEPVAMLDSCGVGHLGSHLLIAGIEPVEAVEISDNDPAIVLELLDAKVSGELASIFTLSYDLGRKMTGVRRLSGLEASQTEPDAFVASFDALIVHDYDTGETRLTGRAERFAAITAKLHDALSALDRPPLNPKSDLSNFSSEISDLKRTTATSNFTKNAYLAAIETIKERIRCGDTYQTNLTQQLNVTLGAEMTPQVIFHRLRSRHPAPFAAFIRRLGSTVISASPERFFRVNTDGIGRSIATSPIKGTRRRGKSREEDEILRQKLLKSPKDRAENTMIVDLLRNDLGRVCEYGSVEVEKLCALEEHPTLFHLVSTITGELRREVIFSDILRAVFPCGSITGAPKISTMKIIDTIETTNRGLSMGAIGYYVPNSWDLRLGTWDLSVAIRTMVVRDNIATFNVGGGIVIDSEPEKEYEESLLKAQALLAAINADTLAETGTK